MHAVSIPLALKRQIVRQRERPITLRELRLEYCFEPTAFIHEETLKRNVFTRSFLLRDFALYDGQKVTGYLVSGHYFDFRKIY